MSEPIFDPPVGSRPTQIVLNTVEGFDEYGLAAAYVRFLEILLSVYVKTCGAPVPALVAQAEAYRALHKTLIQARSAGSVSQDAGNFAVKRALARCRQAHKEGVSPGKLLWASRILIMAK